MTLFLNASADDGGWLSKALVGAVIAALGYVGKEIWDAWTAFQKRKQERKAQIVQLQSRLRAHCHVCGAPHIGAVYREASHSSDAAATCAYQRTPAEIRSRSTPTRYEAVCDPGLHRRSSQYDDNDRDHDHSDRYAHTRAQAEIV